VQFHDLHSDFLDKELQPRWEVTSDTEFIIRITVFRQKGFPGHLHNNVLQPEKLKAATSSCQSFNMFETSEPLQGLRVFYWTL